MHTRQQLLAVLDRPVCLGEGVDARVDAGEGTVTFRLTGTLAFASPGSTTIAASPAFLPSPADAFMPPFALPPVLHAAKTTTSGAASASGCAIRRPGRDIGRCRMGPLFIP
ncbi:hypothetical protein ACFZDP_32200 [Streptomyces mirabilis]|uniref:hypothetical protein n=1 Tax=Streptomyces mirabilis TaxID=68239 RepID=UPI0036EAAFA6